MATVRWTGEPARLRSGSLRLDNLALVPASLLPYKARYQRLANQLPPGAVLIVLPTEAGPEQETLRATAARFLAKGHPVTTISADDVLAQPRRSAKAAQTPSPLAPEPMPVAAIEVTPAVPAPPLAGPVAGEVPAFTQELRLVQIDASQEPARFWALQWQPTLFAGVALVEVQGRIGRPARARVLQHADQPQLDAAIEQLVRRRLQQGYQLVDWV
jgi:predicted DNA-binding WGR domain protein